MSNFADRLKELRKAKNLKQTDMAMFLEINIRTYQDYEYGNVTPNAPMLIKLADFFQVSTDYLLGRANYPLNADGNIAVKAPLDSPIS